MASLESFQLASLFCNHIFNKPCNVFIDAVEIFLHQRKDGGIEFFFLFTGKLFVGTFAENFKVIEAESFGICHLCTEIHIFLYMEKKVFM